VPHSAPKGSEQKHAEFAKVAKLKAREAGRRQDWCEKTSTMLARTYGLVRFEKLNIKNMTRSARGTAGQPGKAGQAESRTEPGAPRAGLGQQPTSRQDRAGFPAPDDQPVPEG
jgi:putative transposase